MKLLLLLPATLLMLAAMDSLKVSPIHLTTFTLQDNSAKPPTLPATEGVFFQQGSKYLELTTQNGKGVDIGRLVQKRTAKFRATVTLPEKPATFVVNESRPAFLVHLPKQDMDNFKLIRLPNGGVAGQALFTVSGYSGTVPVLSSSLISKAIVYQMEKSGDNYYVLKPKTALVAGFYALIDTDPAEPRVWTFSVK